MKSKTKNKKIIVAIAIILIGFIGTIAFLKQPDSIVQAKLYLANKYGFSINKIHKLSYYKGSRPMLGEGGYSPTEAKLEYNGKIIHLENDYYSNKLWRDDYQMNDIWDGAKKMFQTEIEFTDTIIPDGDFVPVNEKYDGNNLLSILPKAFDFGFTFLVPADASNKDEISFRLENLGENYPKALNLFRKLNTLQDIIIYDNQYKVIDDKKWANLDDDSSGGNFTYSSTYQNTPELYYVRYHPDSNSLEVLPQ